MPVATFNALDPSFKSVLRSASRWTLCIGAGVSIGLLPSWFDLSKAVIESALGVTFSPVEFKSLVDERGWAFDAWIQAAMNAYTASGKSEAEFTTLVETALYAPLRADAQRFGVEEQLFLAFNNPQLLDRKEFERVLTYLERSSASVVALARVLLDANVRGVLPAAVITFNYDVLLETIVRMIQIGRHWRRPSASGIKTHPPTILKRVTGPAVPLGDKTPVFYIHGCLTPPPPVHRGKGLRDARDSIVGAEATYLRVASSPFSWAQTTFLHFAQGTNMLIVGQSMSDPNIRRWLSWTSQVRDAETATRAGASFHEMPHIWLTTAPKSSAERSVMETALTHLGVRVAWLKSWSELELAVRHLIGVRPARRGVNP